MLQSLFSGVSGMLANQSEMDVIGNNIANANTTAFKGGSANFTESFQQVSDEATANKPVGLSVGLGTQVNSTTTDFSQGVFQRTNVPTDMAINGDGWFAVQSAGGANYVTRSGDFVQDNNGYLRTADGNFLLGTSGSAAPASPATGFPPDKLQIPATITASGSPVVSFSVDTTGAITVTGQDGSSQISGYISLQHYSNNNGLANQGSGLYSYQPAAGTNQNYSGGSSGVGTIQTGVLESSNVDLSTEFSNMIIAQRGFEASARVISVSDNMLQTVTQLKTQ